MTITNDLSNFGLMANAMYNSMTANATAITSLSVGIANSANLTTTTNVATIGTAAYFVANGNVGIGTASPTARLDVSGGIRALGGATYGTGVAGYSFGTNDTDGGMFSPADGTLVFATNNAERMRIDSNGNVGIGTNSPISKLNVNGDVYINGFFTSPTYYSYGFASLLSGYTSYLRFYHTPGVEAGAQFIINGYVYTFRNDGVAFATSWTSTSDSRVKSNQIIIENSLDKIQQLKGITYKRDDLTRLDGLPVVDAGVIAQDVEKVLPQCVERSSTPPESDPDGEGLLSLNYNGVTALLVNAVKELNAKTDAALAAKDAEIEALKARLDDLENKLNQLLYK